MIWVRVAKLLRYADPLATPPWQKDMLPITKKEVLTRAKGNLKEPRTYNSFWNWKKETRQEHIDRIAWLTVHGWGDSQIVVDLRWNWILYDGNHRLAAAICRGDEMIWAEVYGPKEDIKELC